MRDNLRLCLRGAASRWWTFELSEVDKFAVRGDNSPLLLQWTMRLQSRFRPRMAQAVRENSELTFKVSDIRSGKRVLAYFQSKILRARAAGFESVQSQLIQVYSGMDVQLRLHLYEPTPQTTLDQYRELLMEKEENWIEAYKPRPQPQRFPQNRLYLQNAGYNVARQQLSFDSIKEALCSKTVLIHHDGHLPLLIDVDSSVEGGYDAVEVIQEATVNMSIFCN